jgi:DNA mismatch repair protein MutH
LEVLSRLRTNPWAARLQLKKLLIAAKIQSAGTKFSKVFLKKELACVVWLATAGYQQVPISINCILAVI